MFRINPTGRPGTLGEFSVASDGSLTRIGTITGLPVFSDGNGMVGIAATLPCASGRCGISNATAKG